MDVHTLEKLEFDRVREMVARCASCALGKSMALKAKPVARKDLLGQWHGQVREMIEAAALNDLPPFGGVHDIRNAVKSAVPPHLLEPEDLAVVGETFQATHHLVDWLAKLPENATQLRELAESVGDFRALAEAIQKVVGPTGEVRDEASAKLRKIRSDIANDRISVKHVVDRVLRDRNLTKWLRYPEATFHDDRLVLPLAAEHRGRIKGIVHRTSDSGATLFVEPAEAVEINNRIIAARHEETAEINRLLWHLTHQIHLNAKEILNTLDALAVLDFITAKVRFARTYRMTVPRVSDDAKLRLRQARHPLLLQMQNEAAQHGEKPDVVAIDVRLSDDFDVLVITGPNTGGKTVALKTVALLCLMAQAGFPIPADEGSCVPVYKDIFVDIGDEQSLQQSLSTFSAHLKRLMIMLERAKPGTLVLIDELGAGTDPDEGAAIGQAIVRELLERGVPALITTHLSVLKSLAFTEARAENASVEFDVETLRPTYRLLIGEPGNSNAINIASRLGLPDKIITEARKHLSTQHQQLHRAIRGTLESRRAAERARAEAENAMVDAQKEKDAAAQQLAALRARELEFEKWMRTISSLQPGDRVHVKRFDRDGRVVRMKMHKQVAVVSVGTMEIEVPLKELTLAEDAAS
jgi:DNA mismatch repair protein MutS2